MNKSDQAGVEIGEDEWYGQDEWEERERAVWEGRVNATG